MPRDPHSRRVDLRCDRLDDRITPTRTSVSPPPVPLPNLPATGTELVATTSSSQAYTDLLNVVAALGLGNQIDVSRSGVVLSQPGSAIVQVGLVPGVSVPGVTQSLLSTGLYTSVTPNYVYAGGFADLRERVPNDPAFPNQYAHSIIRTPQAWDRTAGVPTVTTAILDDGVDINHPDLKDTAWVNAGEVPGDGIDNDGNGFVDDANGWDFVRNTPSVLPDSAADSHGTELAGLIAGKIDNGVGVAGVAGNSRILPLKVIGSGPTTSLTIARAVSYAVAAGARVINNSLNIDGFVGDPTFQTAVRFAHSRGLLWVNSAGNDGRADPPRVAFEEMLIVAATDRDDVKAGYSNYGRGIDISAPGGTASDGLLTTVPGGGYGFAFGTSAAAALVSGSAALVWSAFPNLTRDQVAGLLTVTADDIGGKNPGLETLLGSGRLNVGKALAGPRPPAKLGPLTGLPDEGETVDGLVSSFSLRIPSTLGPATVVPNNFDLRWAGADDQFGTPDDVRFPLTINDGRPYRYGTNTLDFTFSGRPEPGRYRFTATSGGLADPFGLPVDGDASGTAGGSLVRTFRIGYEVGGKVFEDVQDDGFESDDDPGLGGETVYVDTNGNGILDRTTFTGGAAAIPDGNPSGTVILIPVSDLTRPVGSVGVSVVIDHPRPSDLVLTLVSPAGQRVRLLSNRGLPGGRLQLLIFDDLADGSATDSPTLTSRRLRPDEPLSSFIGTDGNGVWRLEVADTVAGQSGDVASASLTIAEEPNAVSNTDGFFAIAKLDAITGVRLYVDGRTDYVRSADGGAVVVSQPGDKTPTAAAPSASIGMIRSRGVYGRVVANGRGLAGACVFLDRDGNGVPSAADLTTLSDAGGNYSFGGLDLGNYAVRFVVPAGYAVAGSPTGYERMLTADAPRTTGNDFLLARDTGPVRLEVAPPPAVRNTPLDTVSLTLGEPIAGFDGSAASLTRNGVSVPLGGLTLFGTDGKLTLAGLGGFTGGDGEYRLTITPPPPADDPSRRPVPVTVTWTTDATPPTGRAELVRLDDAALVSQVRLVFSEPVTGLTKDGLRLRRNGVAVSLATATLNQVAANEYALIDFADANRVPGAYTLEVLGGSAADAAGNPLTAFTTDWRVGPPPRPGAGPRVLAGADAGAQPLVAVYDAATGRLVRTFLAFEPDFTGGVRVASGDVNGDGIEDIIAAAGPGGGPRLRAFDGFTGELLYDILVFEEGFTGGLNVAAGDLTADGRAEVVVAPDLGGGPRVRVFAGPEAAPVADFFGIDDPNFRGGARVAVGDLNGDGRGDLVVAAGFGGGPRVAGFEGRSVMTGSPARLFNDFFAFEPGLRNGVYVSSADADADGYAELFAAGGPGGGPRVTAFGGKGLIETGRPQPVANFIAGDPNARLGIRIAAKDTDGDGRADVYAGDPDPAGTTVRVYFARDYLESSDPFVGQFLSPFDGVRGGVFVG